MEIDVELVSKLVAEQFPQWAGLPVRPVELSGWDNRTFHLGERMTVRLPSAEGYTPQVEKEHHWLPRLAPHLPLPIPVPLGRGVPSNDFPWPWSVYRWIEGESAITGRIADLAQFAAGLAKFLVALQGIDASEGPPAGPHSFYRGAPLSVYDADTQRSLALLAGEIDTDAAQAVWDEALRTTWDGPPVWFHGDVAAGNLLVRDGELSAVIDFGCTGVGDPACDLAIAWTLFSGESRAAFRAGLPLDEGTWARGRGWALWKALITLAEYRETNPLKADEARYVINEVLSNEL